MILLLTSLALAQDCDTPSSIGALNVALAQAEAGIKTSEMDVLTVASDLAREDLVCLGDVLTPAVAARYHRVEGLRHFVERSEGAAKLSFAAARLADPKTDLGGLMPEGHRIHTMFQEVDTQLDIAKLESGPYTWIVDGTQTDSYTPSIPQIVQLLNTDGRPVDTRALAPGESPPAQTVDPELVAVTPTVDADPELEDNRRRKVGLLAATGGTALAAGGLWAGSLVAEGNYDAAVNTGLGATGDPITKTELDQLRGITNTYGLLSLGMLATSVVTGAFLLQEF